MDGALSGFTLEISERRSQEKSPVQEKLQTSWIRPPGTSNSQHSDLRPYTRNKSLTLYPIELGVAVDGPNNGYWALQRSPHLDRCKSVFAQAKSKRVKVPLQS